MGVPGHAGTGAVEHAVGARRGDLGTIPGAGDNAHQEYGGEMPRSESFVGSLTSLFFGRKGGLL